MNNPINFIKQNESRFIEELKEILRIKSISAVPEHNHDMKKAAEWIAHHLKKIGISHAEVMTTKGHPIVYAEMLVDPTKPTVLIYGHYDVQSPDPLDQWESDPFEPVIRSGNIYARGTADNKGQFFTHVKAVEALLAENKTLPVNLKFVIEGEEEVGGAHLDEFIEENKSLLKSDVCVISDTHSLSPTQPMIDYGLRGLVYTEVTLSVMPRDVHSGLYGGNVPSASFELASLIAKLKDSNTQKVSIPHFYDDVRQLSQDEIDELARSPLNEKSVLEETQAKTLVGVEGFNVGERGGSQPTLDIHGMWSGYTGEGPKTIIPAKAGAKISMRLVPNQNPDKIEQVFYDFVRSLVPDYADIEIKTLSKGNAILMDTSSKYFKSAEKVLAEVFGNKPLYTMSGGSIPVTATFKNVLGIDSVLLGFGLPDDGLHSPNEKMSLEMFYKGIETSVKYLLELGAQ